MEEPPAEWLVGEPGWEPACFLDEPRAAEEELFLDWEEFPEECLEPPEAPG